MRRLPGIIALVVAVVSTASTVGSGVAGAHTESDLIAVPAGSRATVTLKPTHGCSGSPTVRVRIRAAVDGATAGAVDGWTASATPDGEGRTVLEWKDGTLPADATGAFPVHFTAPDSPGELLLFPSVQICENGEDFAWIQGDPKGEYPAPRVLILPAGAQAAASVDDVPADAPGRELLDSVVVVDSATTTTIPATTEPSPSSTATERPGEPEVDATGATSRDAADDSNPLPVIAGVVVVVLVAAGTTLALVRRRRAPHTGDDDPVT